MIDALGGVAQQGIEQAEGFGGDRFGDVRLFHRGEAGHGRGFEARAQRQENRPGQRRFRRDAQDDGGGAGAVVVGVFEKFPQRCGELAFVDQGREHHGLLAVGFVIAQGHVDGVGKLLGVAGIGDGLLFKGSGILGLLPAAGGPPPMLPHQQYVLVAEAPTQPHTGAAAATTVIALSEEGRRPCKLRRFVNWTPTTRPATSALQGGCSGACSRCPVHKPAQLARAPPFFGQSDARQDRGKRAAERPNDPAWHSPAYSNSYRLVYLRRTLTLDN